MITFITKVNAYSFKDYNFSLFIRKEYVTVR